MLVSGDTKFELNDAFTVALGTLSSAPAGVSVDTTAQTVTITNDDSPPTLSIADISVDEGNPGGASSLATFTVTLSNASYLPVLVNFATADDTAIAPGDYTAIRGTLTFAPGETTKTISVGLRSDTLFEGTTGFEQFAVNLSAAINATLTDAQAQGTIVSDDHTPANTLTLNAKTPRTFFDHNHDKVTVRLSGTGTGTLILDGGVLDGADISEINLDGNAAASTLSITVVKDLARGDGLVTLGEATVAGGLASFSGKAVDLTSGGLRADGPVKTITAHAFLAGELFTGGFATDKLALTLGGALGTAGASFLIKTPQTISALKAASVSAGQIDAAALTSISTTAGGFAAAISTAGAVGSLTVKGGSLSGDQVAARFGAVSVTGGSFSGSLTSQTPRATLGTAKALTSLTVTGGQLSGDVDLVGASGGITVKTGSVSGHLTAASFGAVAITGGGFSGTLSSSLTPALLGTTKGLTSLSITGGDLAGNLSFAAATGAITVKSGALLGNLTAANFGAVSVTGGVFSGTLISSTPAATFGATKALASLSVTGSLSGIVKLAGVCGPITVKTGGVSGELTAASFGAVSVTGGDFSGALVSLTPAATLGASKALTSLTVTDGNLTGEIRLLGASGAIIVRSQPTLARGDINGASIVASAIASLTVARDFISSVVLAGADLGADYTFGGGNDNFAAGTIGAVKIGRSVSAGSIIGAGFSTTDANLKDANDTIVGGVASIIASLTVSGLADPVSYFAAGLFKTAPRIGGEVITPAGDGRFKVG